MEEQTNDKEPCGLGEHARGVASENAHQQGWGLNEEERSKLPEGKQNTYGGTDYEYGARDFGDEPVNTGGSKPEELDKAREVLKKESA